MKTGNTIKLKVCGMRDASNILEIAEQQPDFMGFIFYPKSPRYVGASFRIPTAFPGSIKKVGVFVNETTAAILEKTKAIALDFVQLHGNESLEQCLALKKKNVGVIKVFSVDEEFDFSATAPYEKAVDYFLFDTKGKYYGGNAKTFDWKILERYNQSVPFFLSGGLAPDNIGGIQKLRDMNLYALDVNSGVETAPAVKDVHKIQQLKRAISQTNKMKL